ncbi:DNA-binding transcriptional LysR family regulator [Pararhizobium capsulatum DSM 1112]|uniref:DNA-binding transcriptional LysR family regulator n=1 Tax=Pararhizobium capsulatum DSM 1112 TaxID=1121113 RepID=A0ABU0BZG3_9HYPH|nr:LysR substrate-binding domain-containing protein [Pararhizobium capsulatum]MDQ0323655.1 DNA-binding transcriptional LysR family regulator [Pararhizobium capsulatum DSM 1112]
MVLPVNIDMDVLRTFVTGVNLGSFAKAADRLGRSPSAISLQLRKLEGQAGQTLFQKQGRGLALTEAGDILFGYAKRILELNDEARSAMTGLSAMQGWIRIGLPQDFAETWFPALLGRFARAHPKVRVEARVDRGSDLAQGVARGDLDLALTWGRMGNVQAEIISTRHVVWIGLEGFKRDEGEPLPLIAFDSPCAFRSAALQALDHDEIEWRHAFASPSLGGLWAAVTAGLGVTLRTAEGVPSHLCVLDPAISGLPALGRIELALHRSDVEQSPAVAKFQALLIEAIADG